MDYPDVAICSPIEGAPYFNLIEIWNKENLQYGKEYVTHFVSQYKIKDFGNQNVRLVADMTISKALVASLTNVN